MPAYITASDLIVFRDERFIGELLSDSGDPLEHSELLTSPVLQTICEAASGQVESAMASGNRYSPLNLASLTGNRLAYLKRICTILALADLLERRPGVHIEQAKYYAEQAKNHLDDLRQGKNLFSLADESDLDAATPSTEGPTAVEYERLNMLPDRMGRHFPARRDRIPTDRLQ